MKQNERDKKECEVAPYIIISEIQLSNPFQIILN